MAKKDKKNKKNNDDNPDFRTFTKNIAYDTLFYICFSVVFIGSIGVYMCKVAQANVLPDNLKEIPFSSMLTDVETIEIESNITKEYGWHGLGWLLLNSPLKEESQSIHFDNKQVLNTYFKGLYGKLYLNQYKSNIILYFLHIFDIMFSTNNMITNNVFQFINSVLPEWMILIIFPFVAIFLLIIMVIINIGTSTVSHILCIQDWFLVKDKSSPNNSGDYHWEDYKDIRYMRIMPLILVFIFMFVSIWSILIVSGISIVSWIVTPFFVKYFKQGDNSSKYPFSFIHFMTDIMVHKRQLLLIILSGFTVKNSYTHLGPSYAIGAVIAMVIAFLYNVYCQKTPENDPTFHPTINVSTTQAKKRPGKLIAKETMFTTLSEGA